MKKYTLVAHKEAEMEVTNFRWDTDFENNALLKWEWPTNKQVKYMLVAATEENPADPLKWLMKEPATHTVVTRNLAKTYEAPIGDSTRRFILAPAYLKDKGIAVYGPALVTDLLYAKIHLEAQITQRVIPFSPYKRVQFSLDYSQAKDMELGKAALRYRLHEQGKIIGTYPMDESIQTSGIMHIKKTQQIQFFIADNYAHLLTLV